MSLLIGTSSKMNLTSSAAAAYLDALRPLVADVVDRDVFVLLPFTAIWVAREHLAGGRVRWGAQDVHPDDAGAHTGDVSAPMLADLGCTYVEVGHHERRRDHGETDELVAAKVAAVQRWGMTAIVCVGEVERGTLEQVRPELDAELRLLRGCDPSRLIVAYEPAWAIGVGAHQAPVAWVRAAHRAIRDLFAGPRDPGAPPDSAESGLAAAPIPVIYGGSVDPAGAGPLLAEPGVDGLFVGRAALDPIAFAEIVRTPVGPGRPA